MKKASRLFHILTVILVMALFVAIPAGAQEGLIADYDFDDMDKLESAGSLIVSDANKVLSLVDTPGGSGKSVKVLREATNSATACLDFDITDAKPEKYVIEASFRLDPDKTMGTTVNRVIGVRKVFDSGVQIESFVFASTANGLFLSDTASGSKVTQKLADLSSTKFIKVSVVVDETAGKYSVYVDGEKAAENLPFVNSNAAGADYKSGVARIAFFSAAAVENVYLVDDIKVYTGTEPRTFEAETTVVETTEKPSSTETTPITGSIAIFVFAGLTIASATAYTVCRKRAR